MGEGGGSAGLEVEELDDAAAGDEVEAHAQAQLEEGRQAQDPVRQVHADSRLTRVAGREGK